jgi:plastocyanin
MAVAPCNAANNYVTAADNTITFGASLTYAPNCLKVTAGTAVTFKGTGVATFSDHPLSPSGKRGLLTGNPITVTQDTIAMKSFTFPTPGFYAYYCMYHDPFDSGGDGLMSGVIWVQ